MRWSQPVTRRHLLKSGLIAAGALSLPWARPWRAFGDELPPPMVDPGSLTRFIDPLPVPPIWSTAELATNGLAMAPGLHRFHSQLGLTPTWGYGGASYLGPTVEAGEGVPVVFSARNRLGPHLLGVDTSLHGPNAPGVNDALFPRASLHLHGGYTERASDGYPDDTFLPGTDHLYRYVNDQEAATLWYHDHALGITRLNVYAGLAGFYLLRGAMDASLPGGNFEIPLVLQDKRLSIDLLTGTNPLAYPNPWEPEFFGDLAVINGAIWPHLEVARGWYRFRLLNGSSSRFYNLALDPHGHFLQVGTDGGYLDQPRMLDSVVLAPGERADLLVNFGHYPPGSRVRLANLPLPEFVESPAEIAIDDLVEFRVGHAKGWRGPIPRHLGGFAPLPSSGVTRRTVLLTEIINPETDDPVMALLNARPWDTDDLERPVVNTVEDWEIVNLTADTHPIHLHLIQFQGLDRQPIDVERYLVDVFGTDELHPSNVGGGLRPFPSADGYVTGRPTRLQRYEVGWKDTIQAHPGMVTRFRVPFGPDAAAVVPFGHRVETPFTGRYVWHCHILDHEDNEMMLPYDVVPA
jgi:FtsP/CotA-like multicopper oxidase with cupredoxin domain